MNKEKGIVSNHANNVENGHDANKIPILRLNEAIK